MKDYESMFVTLAIWIHVTKSRWRYVEHNVFLRIDLFTHDVIVLCPSNRSKV